MVASMVRREASLGTRRAPARAVELRMLEGPGARSLVWIVEDEPAASSLAVELCDSRGLSAVVFPDPLPYLAALRADPPPAAIILDWRLERELSAALFMATRHRLPRTPVMYWTGSPVDQLPAMIRQDLHTVIVDKAAGTLAFDAALAWALTASVEEPLEAAND
jgi:DNA-binding NtrC family response regulator